MPGDILVTNDAYTTGSHLNHVTLTMPLFHEGELIAFTCCMAHWLDIGGAIGHVTTDIYSEGLQIPMMKYQKAGVVNQDLAQTDRHQRAPALARDGRSARAGHRHDDGRTALFGTGGSATVEGTFWRSISLIMDQTEAAARAAARLRFPTESTRRNRSWTTTASTSACPFRSACASKSRAIK